MCGWILRWHLHWNGNSNSQRRLRLLKCCSHSQCGSRGPARHATVWRVAKKTGLNTSSMFEQVLPVRPALFLHHTRGWKTDMPPHSTVFHAGVTEKKKKRKDPCTTHTGMLLDGQCTAKQKSNACSTSYSQAVTHPSTRLAQHCLTSVIGREPVHSVWYGRRQCTSPYPARPLLSLHLPFYTAVILQAQQHPVPKQPTQ